MDKTTKDIIHILKYHTDCLHEDGKSVRKLQKQVQQLGMIVTLNAVSIILLVIALVFSVKSVHSAQAPSISDLIHWQRQPQYRQYHQLFATAKIHISTDI
ncbi:MAG: hypothetical protein ACI3YG_09590 [Prevotella sp.]